MDSSHFASILQSVSQASQEGEYLRSSQQRRHLQYLMRTAANKLIKAYGFPFSKGSKNADDKLKRYLKAREALKLEQRKKESQKKAVVNEHQKTSQKMGRLPFSAVLLYTQFFPFIPLSIGMFLKNKDLFSSIVLESVNSMQMYAGILICFNCYHNKRRELFAAQVIVLMGLNCLTGPYQLCAPIIMGLINQQNWQWEKVKEDESIEQQRPKISTYINIQVLLTFMCVFIFLLKLKYFSDLQEVKTSLKNLQENNQLSKKVPISKQQLDRRTRRSVFNSIVDKL